MSLWLFLWPMQCHDEPSSIFVMQISPLVNVILICFSIHCCCKNWLRKKSFKISVNALHLSLQRYPWSSCKYHLVICWFVVVFFCLQEQERMLAMWKSWRRWGYGMEINLVLVRWAQIKGPLFDRDFPQHG